MAWLPLSLVRLPSERYPAETTSQRNASKNLHKFAVLTTAQQQPPELLTWSVDLSLQAAAGHAAGFPGETAVDLLVPRCPHADPRGC